MSRRRLMRVGGSLGLALAGAPLGSACRRSEQSAHEAQPTRVYRVGWLGEGPPRSASALAEWDPPLTPDDPIVAALAELGYIEGRTVRFEIRRATSPDQLATYAAELVALDVDLILVWAASNALRAAAQVPGTTPVVMGGATNDPVGMGYAQSLARPGGKVTGATAAPVGLPKRLDVFKEVLPALARLGVLLEVGEESPFTRETILAQLTPAARDLGVELDFEEFRTLDELDGACAALARAGADAVLPLVHASWTGGDPMRRIVGAGLRQRLATSGLNRPWAQAGAIFAYGPDIPALIHRTARYVDKVLRGARPETLPIEQPAAFELVINLCTAEKLGLTIPPGVLGRATEVIQCR